MMNALCLFAAQSWHTAGWTMLHALWAGTLVALAGMLCRCAVRRAGPQASYAISLGTLLSLACLPLGIAYRVHSRSISPTSSPSSPLAAASQSIEPLATSSRDAPMLQTDSPLAQSQALAPIVIELADNPPLASGAPPQLQSAPLPPLRGRFDAPTESFPSSGAPLGIQVQQLVSPVAFYLPWLWLAGAPITFLLNAAGLLGAERLRRDSALLVEGSQRAACDRLAQSLGIRRRVDIASCARCAQPLLIGIIRPLILLPPAALNGWTIEELEMVLWHELAHVRRWDNLVNFGQRLIESALFFHPVVWLISRQVRRDREECCDALVVQRTAQPKAYAELLLRFAANSATPFATSGAALARHPLGTRIRRILRLPAEPMRFSRGALTAGFAALALLPVGLEQFAGGGEQAADDAANTPSTNVFERVEGVKSPDENPFDDDAVQANPFAESAHRSDASDGPEDNPFATPRESVEPAEAPDPFTRSGGVERPAPQPADPRRRIEREFEERESDEVQPAPFLSLEDQRAADLAYRVLRIELEPLSKEEIARVAKLKFRGGLRVSQASPLLDDREHGGAFGGNSFGSEGPTQVPRLMPGDLLVGLHSWATTSLKQVRQVLERDDLLELAPLKFYVVRAESPTERPAPERSEDAFGGYGRESGEYGGGYGGEMGGYGGEYGRGMGGYGGGGYGGPSSTWIQASRANRGDRLVTGRIDVEQGAVQQLRQSSDGQQPTWTNRVPAGYPQAGGVYGLASRSWYVPVPAGSPQDATTPGEAGAPLQSPQRFEAEVEVGDGKTPNGPPSPADAVQQYAPSPEHLSPTMQVRPISPVDVLKYVYLYEGKSFEEWLTAWKYELSIAKRFDVIGALTAFGGVGRGKEAAEAIIDVASEYDWTGDLSGSDSGMLAGLMNACIDAFGRNFTDAGRLPMEECRPALLAAMRSDDRQKQLFSTFVVKRFFDGEIADAWLEMTRSDDEAVRRQAMTTFKNAGFDDLSSRGQDRLIEILVGDDNQELLSTFLAGGPRQWLFLVKRLERKGSPKPQFLAAIQPYLLEAVATDPSDEIAVAATVALDHWSEHSVELAERPSTLAYYRRTGSAADPDRLKTFLDSDAGRIWLADFEKAKAKEQARIREP